MLGACSRKPIAVVAALDNQPNIRESSLDDLLVTSFIPKSIPILLGSGAVVTLQVHNIGGLRRVGKWETADIAIIVHVANEKAVLGQKLGFLQAKRLYPHLRDIDDDDPLAFAYGMNGMLFPDPDRMRKSWSRDFVFNTHCRYQGYDLDQNKRILDFNSEFGECIYYLFYNPSSLPMRVKLPTRSWQIPADIPLGCKVSKAQEVLKAYRATSGPGGPTRTMVAKHCSSSDWCLPNWAKDLLACKVGKQFDHTEENFLYRITERRSGPISAAVRIAIDLPQG